MFELFWQGVQQDFKLMLVAPLVCAIFRLVFIWIYGPKKTPKGEWRKWFECFRYGFWWGLDFNAYVFLYAMVLVSLPGAFIPVYYELGDTVRLVGGVIYLAVLYTAFMGKLIFYYHFHDTFNATLKLGRKADKKNFMDIFFRQNHGIWILLGYIPYLFISDKVITALLSLPSLAYIKLDSVILQYGFNTLVFIGALVFFYWLRYGGTLNHRHKPEWDDVPPLVKNDLFMGKATMDDLIALELALKQPVSEALKHDDEEAAAIMQPLLGKKIIHENPLECLKHQAKGALITKPKHIFFLLGESHAQVGFDALYKNMHLMSASEEFRRQSGTVAINSFLPGGMRSRPSLVSITSGIYDADMELNENKNFWYGNIPTSLPLQLKKLGYRTEFWYGGALNHGCMEHFAPAIGFDVCHPGPELCGNDAPQTWLGVYDHVFLAKAAELIKSQAAAEPVFHLLYTTSNHGPYAMPFADFGFDIDKIMPEMPLELRRDKKVWRQLGAAWYADQSLMKFVKAMQAEYPDSLFIVTGDHSAGLIPYKYGLAGRKEPSLREEVLTSFAMHHPELTVAMLANNTIGGHMNIMPTIIELIAPKGFEYLSLVPALTEPIDHVVTPYCWLSKDELGYYHNHIAQSLAVTSEMLPIRQAADRFKAERDAYVELTGWIIRHPELLDDAGIGKLI